MCDNKIFVGILIFSSHTNTNKKNQNHSIKLVIQNRTHGSCIYKFIQLLPKTILSVGFYSIKMLSLLFLVAFILFYFTS